MDAPWLDKGRNPGNAAQTKQHPSLQPAPELSTSCFQNKGSCFERHNKTALTITKKLPPLVTICTLSTCLAQGYLQVQGPEVDFRLMPGVRHVLGRPKANWNDLLHTRPQSQETINLIQLILSIFAILPQSPRYEKKNEKGHLEEAAKHSDRNASLKGSG